MRASTTPSICRTSASIFSAIFRAFTRFLLVIRTFRGVDRPSFIAERIIPPASKANSNRSRVNAGVSGGRRSSSFGSRFSPSMYTCVRISAKRGSSAKPFRSCSTHSCAERDRSDLSCTLRIASIGPEFCVNAADQSAVSPISLMTSSRSSPSFSFVYVSTRLHVPLCHFDSSTGFRAHSDFKRSGVDLREELATQV